MDELCRLCIVLTCVDAVYLCFWRPWMYALLWSLCLFMCLSILVDSHCHQREQERIISKLVSDKDKIDTYRQNLANISVSKFQGMLDMIENYDENVDISVIVNEVVKCFNDGIRNAAVPLYLRSFLKRKYDTSNLHKSSSPALVKTNGDILKGLSFFRRDRYIRSSSDVNLIMMTDARKHYKYISRKKRIEYDKIQTNKLMDARCKNAKLYWKILAGKNRSNVHCPISTGE